MPMYATVGGVQRELSAVPVTVAGVQREQDQMLATIGGVAREIFAAGFKWERYALDAQVVIESVTGVLAATNGDKFYKGRSTLGDGALSVYTDSDGTKLVQVTGNGFITKSVTTSMSSLASSLSELWVTKNGTVVSGSYTTAVETAYYCDGTSTTEGVGYSRIATIGENKGSLIDIVTDKNETAYPDNGIQDGYWYVKI